MFSTTRWWLNSKHESFISHTMLSNPSKRVFSGDSKITRTPSSHNDSERQTFLMWSVWPPDWQMTRQNILFSANSPNPQDRSVTNKGGQPPKHRALLILQGPVKNKQTKQKKQQKVRQNRGNRFLQRHISLQCVLVDMNSLPVVDANYFILLLCNRCSK